MSSQAINVLPKNPDNVWLQAAWTVSIALTWLLIFLSIPGYVQGFDLLEDFTTRNDAILVADIVGRTMAAVSGLVSLFLAYLLYRQRHVHPVTPYLALFFLLYGVLGGGTGQAAWTYWIGNPVREMPFYFPETFVSAPLAFTLLIFPNGKLAPRWAWWVVAGYVLGSLSGFWIPDSDSAEWVLKVRGGLDFAWFFVLPCFALYAVMVRYRRFYTRQERQQTKWLFLGLILLVVLYFVSAMLWTWRVELPEDADVSWWVVLNSFTFWSAGIPLPVTLTISILYYNLWDINVVINRTLVYAILTASVIAIYVLVVGGMGTILHAQGSPGIALFATGIVAVSFQGLRDRIQRGVNRFMYGERDEPYLILTRLGHRLKNTVTPSELLSTTTETIATALKLPYVAIAIRYDNSSKIRATFGSNTTPGQIFPLIYQNELIGELIVGQRSAVDTLTPGDYQVLENIAQHIGAAVHSVRLSLALQESRERLVTAIEEERRRLRRDLHDGMGPALASQTLKLDAAADLVTTRPESAIQLIYDLKAHTKALVADIRRLVYDLRPPALDNLGLVESLRSYVQQVTTHHNGLSVTLDISDPLPAMSAAMEVAIYRITQEALTNVIKHAGAQHCEITLHTDSKTLSLSIQDDGQGLPRPLKTGVGLQSMRERAEELGGQFLAENRPGAVIKIAFPLIEEAR